MKIAFILRHYHKRGGISNYVAELSERFADNNEVHVFASSWQDVGNSKITFHKVPMLSFAILRRWKKFAWNNVFEVGSFLLSSYFMIKYGEFDIIHNQGDYLGKSGVYTAHSCHKAWLDLFNKTENPGLIGRLKKSALNPLHICILLGERYSLAKTQKVIAISNGIKEELVKYYNVNDRNLAIIPNGVDITKFNPQNRQAYRDEIRAKYKLKNTDFVIIFPAHEFKRKGLPQIIEALGILKKENIYLLVAGRDASHPYFDIIEKHNLKDKIIFAGETPEIEKYYLAGDIMVFPTAYEPFGLAILEGMSCGLPVVTSAIAGASELIENGVDGILLADFKNIENIAHEIESLQNSAGQGDKIGTLARKKAENYSWDNIAQKTYAVYEEALRDKKKNALFPQETGNGS